MAAQFFLKNVHPEMRDAASDLFGNPESLSSRPNVFGELMRVLISPSEDIKEAVNWVVGNGVDPDITLHMRMLMNRYITTVLFVSSLKETFVLNNSVMEVGKICSIYSCIRVVNVIREKMKKICILT